MTKKELEAENKRLAGENAGLREVLTAIAGARPPLPVNPDEMHRYYTAGSDRLMHVAIVAGEVARYAGEYVPGVASGHARSLREYLAGPLRYEAEPCARRRASDGLPCRLNGVHEGRRHEAWEADGGNVTWTDDECAGPEPASPELLGQLAGAIITGTPLLVTDLCQYHGGEGQSGSQCGACSDEHVVIGVDDYADHPDEADGFASAEQGRSLA